MRPISTPYKTLSIAQPTPLPSPVPRRLGMSHLQNKPCYILSQADGTDVSVATSSHFKCVGALL